MDRGRRAIIVDNYHKLRIPTNVKKQLISDLHKFASKVILFTNNMVTDLEEIIQPHVSIAETFPIEHYEIQPLGYLGRNQIVESWLSLGESDTGDPLEYAHELSTITAILNTVFGRNFVPAYPVFVLIVLQSVGTGQSMDTNAGAQGYFFELLVRAALFRGRSKKEFDIAAGYLAHLAYIVFCFNRNRITLEELAQIHKDYQQRYDIRRSQESIVGPLIQQQILVSSNDYVHFKYEYMLYYFVALYIRDHIRELEVRNQLTKLVESIHSDRSSNILLFLAHLTRDPVLIDELQRLAKLHYAGLDEATLDTDARFLLQLGTPRVALTQKNPQEERQHYLIAKDETERALTKNLDEEAIVDADIEPVVKLNAALRNLEVLGQILKNFPGTLEGETKARIAKDCYSIGRRTLTAIFEMIRQNETDILTIIFDSLRMEHHGLSESQMMEKARYTLMSLAYGIAFGIIKKVSQSVGAPDLAGTYDRLQREDPVPLVLLFDTSIRLDHMSVIPVTKIEEQAESFQNNPVALSLLRHLVVQHLRLFPVEYRTAQALCARLEIPLENTKALPPGQKILKSS